MAYIFFHSTIILCQHPDRQIVKTNIQKIPKGFFISPTESKLFIKFHYLLWYHTFLTSLFTTFYIPCAIDFIKSRFYLQAIFTVLLKTKLFLSKNRNQNHRYYQSLQKHNQSYHSDIQPYADLHKSGHLKQFLFG